MSKQAKKGSSAGDKALGWLMALAAAGGGFYVAPVLVKAAIVAGLVLVAAVWSVAKATGQKVAELLALLLGKALLVGFKGAAIGLVEWPLRIVHRAGIRFEVRLRTELAVARMSYRCWDGVGRLVRAIGARSNRTVAVEAARATGALVLVLTNRITRRPNVQGESVRESA